MLKVSSSPHIRNIENTTGIMFDVIIALIPLGIAGVIMYGFYAALIIAVSVAAAVTSEYLWCKAIKKQATLRDLSAVVTGLLIAYNLPPTIPLWMAALGSAIAIIVVKQMFGGLGHNFANPAITARIVLMVSFPAEMTNFILPFAAQSAVSSPTPLSTFPSFGQFGILRLFLGNYPGCLGETSALLILVGGIYLVWRKVISPIIPVFFCGTVFLFTLIATGNPVVALSAVCSGGVMLGAVFMATDYVTSPKLPIGKIIFAVGCGLITMLIRIYGNLPEGVSFSILLMNLLTPLIDKIPGVKPFGYKEEK